MKQRLARLDPYNRASAPPDRAPVRCSSLAGPTARPPLGEAIWPGIDIPPQRHTGDIERFANVLNGRGFVGVELFHQSDLSGGEGFSKRKMLSRVLRWFANALFVTKWA